MKTSFLFFAGLLLAIFQVQSQEPVLIAGGTTAITPVVSMGVQAAPVQAVQTVPVAYVLPVQPVLAVPPVAYAPQVVSGGYYNQPNVIYFGGPNSCYYNSYPGGCYRPGCSYYTPSVIYFGRGEACERGYAFRHYR